MAAEVNAEMVARLRRLAEELTWANQIYNYEPNFGSWSPNTARYEADYLEAGL